jgi:hypothetical protein
MVIDLRLSVFFAVVTSILKYEAASSSETLFFTYKIARFHNTEDYNLKNPRHESMKMRTDPWPVRGCCVYPVHGFLPNILFAFSARAAQT